MTVNKLERILIFKIQKITSETPILDCLVGKLVSSSAILKYSENERRADKDKKM
jgi:hypothetical protein